MVTLSSKGAEFCAVALSIREIKCFINTSDNISDIFYEATFLIAAQKAIRSFLSVDRGRREDVVVAITTKTYVGRHVNIYEYNYDHEG